VGDAYRFDEHSYDALAKAGIAADRAVRVTKLPAAMPPHRKRAASGRPRPDGRWIGVALIEEADDEYLVVSARELSPSEAAAVARMIEGDV
jgi:hypothetical protein